MYRSKAKTMLFCRPAKQLRGQIIEIVIQNAQRLRYFAYRHRHSKDWYLFLQRNENSANSLKNIKLKMISTEFTLLDKGTLKQMVNTAQAISARKDILLNYKFIENIVNISMSAGSLINENFIKSDQTGHTFLVDQIIDLALEFENDVVTKIDYNAPPNFTELRDYWIEIDEFARKRLLEECSA